MYAVNIVSRYQNNPREAHWNAVKRIFKYLKLTQECGILYKQDTNNKNVIRAYSDADYANDVETRRSTTGYVFLLSSAAVTWNSRRQHSVALSTTESEFVAASEATKEAIWVKQLLSEIYHSESFDLILYIDNQSAIRLIKNPIFHKRTKHIDIRYNFVRERYENNDIDIMFVSTRDQVADIFTKALARNKFEYFRQLLGMC